MMKILQVNCVYKKGSTGKIVSDIHAELLKRGIESIVCYGRGEKIEEPYVYKTCFEFESYVSHFFSYLTGIMYGGCFLATRRLEKIIVVEKPDIVHLQCLNGYFVDIYKLIQWLKNKRIKTVLTLHAEFMHTANCGHALDCVKWKTGCGNCPRLKKETGSFFFDRTSESWILMKNAFHNFGKILRIVSVSPWLKDRALQSPILSDFTHSCIYNGVNTSVFHNCNTTSLRKQHHIENFKIIFFVTPFFCLDRKHLKGGFYVFELAKMLQNENVKIIIAGDYKHDFMIPDNVVMLGRITDQNLLAQYYSMADVTLLTSKRETFSMVAAESLCCGTPVVGFKAGAPEQIALKKYSEFVDQGDMQALKKCVITWCAKEKNSNISKDACNFYGVDQMVASYISLYKNIINNN